jgi:hypothetical protein
MSLIKIRFKRNYPRRIRYMLFVSSVEPLRLTIGLGSLLWAALLFWPGNTFARPVYHYMGVIGPEEAWAIAHLIHGVTAVFSMLTGAKGKLIWFADPILGCVVWTSSAIAMMASVSPLPAAIAPHIVSAVVSWWLLVRYQGDSRDGD